MRLVRRGDLGATFTDDGAVLVRSPSGGVGARVPAVAVGILAFCSQPRTADEVGAAFGPPGRALFAGLAEAGLLVAPERARDTPRFFQNFSALDIHRRMLEDEVRLDAYRRALRAVVTPDRAVLDAGTGSGVLAVMAARAGATRVVAVDASDVVEHARETVRRSGLDHVVTVIRSDMATVDVEAPVDVIVTETFGALALAEGAVADVAACAERVLSPAGIVIPSAITLWFAPVGARAPWDQAVGPFGRLADVDLGALREQALHRGITLTVDPTWLLHPGDRLVRFAFPGGGTSHTGTVRFADLPSGELTGLAGWFVLELAPGIDLPTGPTDPLTHWCQVFLPIDPVPIEAGDTLTCEVVVEQAGDDRRALEVRWRWATASRTRAEFHRLR